MDGAGPELRAKREKYPPFVRNVYITTDGQTPRCLNDMHTPPER
ncbi:hypothetical protein [Streptomyces sp. RKND-216]|nr:hypothetical protein [Streptomyces sp. RKND-216]